MTSRLINRFRLAKSFLLRQARSAGLPRMIGIEPTNRCNLQCIMCPRGQMTRPLGDMDLALFQKIIGEGQRYLEFVWLQDMGEPLLHPQFDTMIRYARERGVRTGISTNATLLTPAAAERLAASGLDYLMFAFDGSTAQTYERIRVNARFETTLANVRHYLKLKQERRLRTFVVMQSIYMPETEGEVRDYLRMWRVPGVDAIRLRQVTYSGNRRGGRFANPRRAGPCLWPWSNPHIKWNGDLVPCCQDADASYVLGNLRETSLAELWNSEKMVELRRKLIEGRYAEVPLCSDCNMVQPGRLAAIASALFHQFAVNRWVPRVETWICRLRFRPGRAPKD